MKIIRDGHTHTEYCPHGKGDPAEKLIRNAIDYGIKEYTIAEHLPLPRGVWEETGEDPEILDTQAMSFHDFPYYVRDMHKLAKKYAGDIKINVGYEVDYLEGYERETADLLREYRRELTDGIRSAHFVKIEGKFYSVDHTPETYQKGAIKILGGFQQAQAYYLRTLLQALSIKRESWEPKRLGHMTLCQKFQRYYREESVDFSPESAELLEEILRAMKAGGYEIDYNHQGLFREYCGETFPPAPILQKASEMGIPVIYGSDSHGTEYQLKAYEVGMLEYETE